MSCCWLFDIFNTFVTNSSDSIICSLSTDKNDCLRSLYNNLNNWRRPFLSNYCSYSKPAPYLLRGRENRRIVRYGLFSQHRRWAKRQVNCLSYCMHVPKDGGFNKTRNYNAEFLFQIRWTQEAHSCSTQRFEFIWAGRKRHVRVSCFITSSVLSDVVDYLHLICNPRRLSENRRRREGKRFWIHFFD